MCGATFYFLLINFYLWFWIGKMISVCVSVLFSTFYPDNTDNSVNFGHYNSHDLEFF